MEFSPAVSPPPEPGSFQPEPKPFPGFWGAVLLVVLVQILANVVAVLVLVAAVLVKGGSAASALDIVDPSVLGILANSTGFGLVVAVAWKRTRQPFGDVFPLRPVPLSQWLPMFPTMAGGLLVVNEITNLLVRYFPPWDFVKDLFAQFLGRGTGPAGFFFLVMVAPITEEFLFRGVVVNGFLPRYGKARAIVGSAALFGLIHLIPWQIVPAFLLGLFFAWWTVETRSLWPALIAHAFTNGFAFVQGLSQDPGDIFEAVPQPFWITALGVALLAAGIQWGSRAFRNRHENARYVMPGPGPDSGRV